MQGTFKGKILRIENLNHFISRNFALEAPGQSIKFTDDEKQEILLLELKWKFIDGIDVDSLIAKIISCEAQKISYRYWKSQGWRKVKRTARNGKKVSLWEKREIKFTEWVKK